MCRTDEMATCVPDQFTQLMGIKPSFKKCVKMSIMSTYPALQLQLLREISFVAALKHTFSACGASFLRIHRKHFAFATTSPWCSDTLNLCKYPCTHTQKKNGSLAVLAFVWVFPHQNTTVTGLLARGREYFCIRLQPSFRVACQTPQKGRSLRLEAVHCGVVYLAPEKSQGVRKA